LTSTTYGALYLSRFVVKSKKSLILIKKNSFTLVFILAGSEIPTELTLPASVNEALAVNPNERWPVIDFAEEKKAVKRWQIVQV